MGRPPLSSVPSFKDFCFFHPGFFSFFFFWSLCVRPKLSPSRMICQGLLSRTCLVLVVGLFLSLPFFLAPSISFFATARLYEIRSSFADGALNITSFPFVVLSFPRGPSAYCVLFSRSARTLFVLHRALPEGHGSRPRWWFSSLRDRLIFVLSRTLYFCFPHLYYLFLGSRSFSPSCTADSPALSAVISFAALPV